MKILHISDTHAAHDQLKLELEGVDVVVHSGDESNYHNPIYNEEEFYNFIEWFSNLPIKNKILIPGNHSSYISTNKKIAKEFCEEKGIILLISEEIVIDGVKFYGEPYTEKFGNWYFTKDKEIISSIFNQISEDVDVLITHGPPKGFLDLATDCFSDKIINVGSQALFERIKKLPKLKAVCYGHIHDNMYAGIKNQNLIVENGIIYSNGSCVTDGYFNKSLSCFYATSNGNVFEI